MSPQLLYHHHAQTGGELEQLTALVREAADPEAIYLLGSTRLSRRTESIFTTTSATSTSTAHYYLLVLVADAGYRGSVQERIETDLQHFVPVTALVLSTTEFTHWGQTGHPFAFAVVQKALPLYCADGLVLPLPPPPDSEARHRENIATYAQSKMRVAGFLAGADLYRIRKEHRLAAFMLHQAAEQALSAMLFIGTGFTANTHNLYKLLRYCSLFAHTLPDLFPARDEKARKLLGLLQRAYIDARYKEGYTISGEELDSLTQKVKEIQSIFLKSVSSPAGNG